MHNEVKVLKILRHTLAKLHEYGILGARIKFRTDLRKDH